MGRLILKLNIKVQLCECLLIQLLRKPTIFAESEQKPQLYRVIRLNGGLSSGSQRDETNWKQ